MNPMPRLLRPVLALSPLALCLPATAQRIPEIEPNDSAAQAQAIAAGHHVAANLLAGEQDWFQFTLAAPAELHLQTSGNFAVNPSVDTGVFLFDASGTTLLAFNDQARGNHSDCGVNLPAGSYTVKVIGKLATTAGDYGLDLIVLPPATIATNEGAEPNHSPMSGGIPTPMTIGGIAAGDLASTGDVDWFTFTLAHRAVVQAQILDDGGTPQLDRSQLALFHESSPGVWTMLGTATTSNTTHRVTTFQHAQTIGPGTYAFQVASGGATGTAPFIYAGVGRYALRTLLLDLPGANTWPEAAEPNDSAATAGTLPPGDHAIGNLTPQDVDWYQFFVTQPTTFALLSDGGTPNPITDTTVRIVDAAGTILGSGTSGGAASHGRAIVTIAVPGTYYVEVRGGTISAQGDYVLWFGGGTALSIPSTFSQQPPSTNACPGSNGLRPALQNPSGEVPMLGSTFVLRLQNALPNSLAATFFGYSNTLTSAGAALPFDLGAAGAPGCFLRVDPLATLGLAIDAGGLAHMALVLPAAPALRGLTLYLQGVVVDPANNALGIAMTNDVRLVLGDRGF